MDSLILETSAKAEVQRQRSRLYVKEISFLILKQGQGPVKTFFGGTVTGKCYFAFFLSLANVGRCSGSYTH